MEATELFIGLESNQPYVVEDVKKKFHELFNSCNPNDTWLVNGLFDYAMQTGSLRTAEILVGIKEPHDTHLFNKFCESLRNQYKLQGLTLLGHVVRKQPTWLFKVTRHSLFKELLKLLKTETEIIPLMSVLLTMNILLPMVAGLMEPYLQELFSAFSYLATWDTQNPSKLSPCHLLHLQMALYALFLRLYGMYPCNFLSYLRHEYSQPGKRTVFSHTIKPMLDNVKMHPLLVTASKESEVGPYRWRRMEPSDVVVECAKLAIGGEVDRPREEGGGSSRASQDFTSTFEGKYQGSMLGQEQDLWSPTSYCGMSTPPESAPTSIPHTPIAQSHIVSSSLPQQEGTSPPEAAVEATPETTPIKDLRHMARGPPSNSSVPRALNALNSPAHSQPSSPLRKEASPFRFPSAGEASAFHQPCDSLIAQKVQRIVTDRQSSIESGEGRGLKPRGLLQPTSPLRVINGPALTLGCESPADLLADREVESMMTADTSYPSWTRSDSVVQDIVPVTDPEELEECQQESCTVGALCMPNSNSMRDFTRQVKSRLRFYSQCHADPPYQGLSTGSSPSDGYAIPVNKVRRANSCPEMKKTSSSLERHMVEKVDEEPSPPLNGHALELTLISADGVETVSTGTQTDNPLPYEHLFLAVFPTVDHLTTDDSSSVIDTGNVSPLPQKRLSPNPIDTYMSTYSAFFCDGKKIKSQGLEAELRIYKEQLQLMGLQLCFEKHRREMHAERNRRLLGKCRKVRSQEELTSALRDQVVLLQTDKELLHSELHKRADEAKAVALQLQDTVTYYQTQNAALQAEIAKEKCLIESLELQLKQEREKTAIVTKALSILGGRNNVQLSWVSGHTGVKGYECADELAREGAATPFIGPEPVCGVSRATARAVIRRWSGDEHRRRWPAYPGQRLSRQMVGGSQCSAYKVLVAAEPRETLAGSGAHYWTWSLQALAKQNSVSHMLDAVLRSKLFNRKYGNPKINQKLREICCPIIETLLSDIPKVMQETCYVRYLLAFKSWRKLAGKEHSARITNLAVKKLIPPKDFGARLKSGIFSSVFPYVAKPDKQRLTWFLMVSAYSLLDSAEAFYRVMEKSQHTINLERPLEQDPNVLVECSMFDNEPRDMAEAIWRNLEAESFEEDGIEEGYFNLDLSLVNDNSLVDTCKMKERVIKSSIAPLTINVDKPVLKKLTSNHMNSKLLNHIATEMSRLDDQEVPSVVSLLQPEESLNAEDSDKSRPQSITEVLRHKPCATVEPKQSMEVEPDSPSVSVNVTSSDATVIVDDLQETSHHQPEEQLHFEIIAEEIIPEEDTTLVFSDLNGQVNVASENVLSAVNMSVTEPCNPGAQTEMIIDNPTSRNALNKNVGNYSKERLLISQENHSVLSPIVENKPDYFSIVRQEDSYDETMLSRLFSEATADDASDDENNYTSRNKFAHGGKVTAFSKQMDESKSDVEEESESPQSSHIEPLSPEDSRVEADYEISPRNTEVDAYNKCRKVRVRLNDINMHPEIFRKNVPDPEEKEGSSQQSSSHKTKSCQSNEKRINSDDEDAEVTSSESVHHSPERRSKSKWVKKPAKRKQTRSTSASSKRTKTKAVQPPSHVVKTPPVAVKSPPVAVKSPPVAVKSPPVAVKSPPVAVKSPPVAVKSPPVAVKSPTVVVKTSPPPAQVKKKRRRRKR